MTVLLVDDSQLLRNGLKSLLTLNPLINVIGEASDGIEAVKMITEKKPDFAIVDIKLPGQNGIEVLKELKALQSETKICILTNYPYRQYREKCIQEGAFKFFDKNNDLQDMINMLNNLAEKINDRS